MTPGLDSVEVLIGRGGPFELLLKVSSRDPREPPCHIISFATEKRSLPLRVGSTVPPSKWSLFADTCGFYSGRFSPGDGMEMETEHIG